MTTEPSPGPEPRADVPIVHWELPKPSSARLGIGAVVGRTLDTFGSDPSIFLALALPSGALTGVLAASPFGFGVAGLIAIAIIALIAGVITSIAMTIATDDMWSGREPQLGALLRRSVARTPALLGASLLALVAIVVVAIGAAVIIGIGFLAGQAVGAFAVIVLAVVLVVALSYVTMRLSMVSLVIILEDVGGLAAFRRSWERTRGSLLRLFGLSLVLGLITLPASMGAQLLVGTQEPVMVGLATLLSTLVTTPVLAIGLTLAWAALAERPYADNEVVRNGRGRMLALALLMGFGILLSAVGIAQGGGNFAGLLPEAGSNSSGRAAEPVRSVPAARRPNLVLADPGRLHRRLFQRAGPVGAGCDDRGVPRRATPGE